MPFAVAVIIIALIKGLFPLVDRSGRQTIEFSTPQDQPRRSNPTPEPPAIQLQPKARQRLAFTVGSTKDEVLAVQGTPSRISDSSFHYGTSDVRFENRRVKSWYDLGTSIEGTRLNASWPDPLKIRFPSNNSWLGRADHPSRRKDFLALPEDVD